MSTSSVSNTTSSSSSSTSSTTSSTIDATYDMFLQLLVAELETQNPLDPVDSTEFVTQLASYSALEQQIETNDYLSDIYDSIDSIASGVSTGLSYLGQTVTVDTDTLTVSDDGSVDTSWVYTLDSDASDVTLTIVNSDGDTVWTDDGETSSGSHTLTWDGTDSDGNTVDAGDYTLEVTATDSSGNTVTTSIAITGTVTAVDSSSGSTILELGDTEVDIDDVTRVASSS